MLLLPWPVSAEMECTRLLSSDTASTSSHHQHHQAKAECLETHAENSACFTVHIFSRFQKVTIMDITKIKKNLYKIVNALILRKAGIYIFCCSLRSVHI